MAGAITTLDFGFFTSVRDIISNTKNDNTGLPTFDITSGVVGTAVVVDGTGNGLRVTGVAINGDGSGLGNPDLRCVVISLAGKGSQLAALLKSWNPTVGARMRTSPVLNYGLVIPDLRTQQVNPFAPAGPVAVPASGAKIHFDECSDNGAQSNPFVYSFGDRGIEIPPNTSVAGVFINMRYWTGGAIAADQSKGNTIGGMLMGYPISQSEADNSQQGRTPSRFNNTLVAGPLAGA